MKNDFKEGDIVKLKSGGPKMTVNDPSHLNNDDRVQCAWFAGSKHEVGVFHFATIERVTDDADAKDKPKAGK